MVLVTFITTPTQAYEAYNNIASLLILEKEELIEQKIIEKALPLKENLKTQIKENLKTQIPSTDIAPKNYELCQIAINEVEQTHNIKENLLTTISSVESGRYIKSIGKRRAWPWTIHAQGKGHYYQTKQEAITAVKKLQKEGVTNIDVGCMQINLKYHGKAFNSLEEAFDPKKNVAYSATFLQSLNKKNNNWQKTAMQYHSRNKTLGLNYKNRLETHYAKFVRKDTSTLF